MHRYVVMFGLMLILAACGEVPRSDVVEARRSVEDYRISSVAFRSMDAFFPTAVVERGDRISVLPTSKTSALAQDSVVNFGDGPMPLARALEATDTNAFLVVADGKLVFEYYRNGADAQSRFIGWSVSKSIVSLLAGIAITQAVIDDIDDPVDKYWPELRGSVYAGVSIRHMLEMRAGTDYSERARVGTADVDVLAEQSLFTGQRRFTDFTSLEIERTSDPGESFNYSTLTTSILGRVLEEAYGLPLAEITESILWQPMGAQSDGFWMLDGEPPAGRAFAGGGFNAVARDYARLGLMVLQGGVIDGIRVVPEAWIAESTRYESDEPVWPGTPRGYGYQWWTFVGTRIHEAVGIHGQYISIDPDTDTVIVKLSYWPERGGGERETFLLLNAVRGLIKEYGNAE